MFTKEQLAQWRAQGFEFDDFYDTVAVDANPIARICNPCQQNRANKHKL